MNLAIIKARLETPPRLPPSPEEVAALVAAMEEAVVIMERIVTGQASVVRARAWLATIKPAETPPDPS